ncbi:hypothetical protein TB1_045258 [Malus domestica]
MEANPILFQRSLRRQTHFAPELFNDKVDSEPRCRTPRLPLAVAHLALPHRRTPYENSNQCQNSQIRLREIYIGGFVDGFQGERCGMAGRGREREE